jgi:hypothetical protein
MTEYRIYDTLTDILATRYQELIDLENSAPDSDLERSSRMRSLEVLNFINYLSGLKPKLDLIPDDDGYIESLDMYLPKDITPNLDNKPDLLSYLTKREIDLGYNEKVNQQRKHLIFDARVRRLEVIRLLTLVNNLEDIVTRIEEDTSDDMYFDDSCIIRGLNKAQLYTELIDFYL